MPGGLTVGCNEHKVTMWQVHWHCWVWGWCVDYLRKCSPCSNSTPQAHNNYPQNIHQRLHYICVSTICGHHTNLVHLSLLQGMFHAKKIQATVIQNWRTAAGRGRGQKNRLMCWGWALLYYQIQCGCNWLFFHCRSWFGFMNHPANLWHILPFRSLPI